MYSKYFLMLLTLGVVSCSYFFDEKQDKSNTYNFAPSEKASINCIENNKQLLNDYFDLKRSNQDMVEELKSMNTCVNDAINLFVKHTKGANADYYTAEEIHDFISSVFDSYSYDLAFLQDVVIVKASLLGGTEFQISKAEVRMLPRYIDFFYQSLAELAPERHLLFSKRQGDNWEQFQAATAKFQKVAARFKNLPMKNSGNFNYEAVVRVATILIDDEGSHWNKTFDLVNSLQAILVKGQRDIVEVQKVPSAVEHLANLYLPYMEFEKFLRDNAHCGEDDTECLKKGFFQEFASVFIFPALVTRTVDYPESFRGKTEILNSTQLKVLTTLRTALAETGGVSLDYINDLIFTLTRIDALPEAIQGTTLIQMAPQFFGHWLTKKSCVVQRCANTIITTEQVDTLIGVVQGWKERQLHIDKMMSKRSAITRTEAKTLLKKSSGRVSSEILDFQDALEQVHHAHWEKYVHIGSRELTYKDLTIFNQLFSIIKLFLAPFNDNAEKGDVVNYWLSQGQVQYFYEWFRPLALELKLIDPRSRNSGKQTFIEINLFGSTSSKPGQMDFTEVIEYFEIALSTGSRTDELMTQKFTKCVIVGEIDVFFYEKRGAECFRAELEANAPEYFFATMPQMMKYYKDSKIADYPKMVKALEKAARQGVIANTNFDTDAVRVMSSISQYAESFFLRFEDANDGDEVITHKELERALAHIVPNLGLLIKENLPESEVKQIYKFFPQFETDLVTYILRYQEVPAVLNAVTTAELLSAAVTLKTWSNGSKKWMENEAAVTREDVMLVVSGLASFSRSSKVKGIRKIFVDNKLNLDKGNYPDPNHAMFHGLAAELSCSTLRDVEVRSWLQANQDKYWKDALQYFDVKIGGYTIQLNATDIPQTGVFSGWEGLVTSKLIEVVAASPIGDYCNLPYLKDVHQITEE